jgi:hypothetical protein
MAKDQAAVAVAARAEAEIRENDAVISRAAADAQLIGAHETHKSIAKQASALEVERAQASARAISAQEVATQASRLLEVERAERLLAQQRTTDMEQKKRDLEEVPSHFPLFSFFLAHEAVAGDCC